MGMIKSKLFNARSLYNKIDLLSVLLLPNDFDLIFVTESWLHSSVPDGLLLSNSAYTVYRKDRQDGYGGVAEIFTRYFKLYCLILIYLLSAWLLIYSSQRVLLIGLCVFTILHLQPMTQNPLKPYVHVLTAILIHVILFLLLVTLTSLLLIGEFVPAVVV